MSEKKETPSLPLYKTQEYYTKFNFEEQDDDTIKKFKKDGELTAETEVRIEKKDDYSGAAKAIRWKRQTRQGTETIRLGTIRPTDGLLECMDKFLEKKGLLSKHWLTTYGTIMSVCKLCEKDQEKFKQLVKKAEGISELLAVSAFRD